MKIAVLMSTYNGQKYIRNQIESILNQNGVDVDLYIRDDGSSDNTLNIIKEYKNIILYQGKNIGVGNSFMNLLYCVPQQYDYYAFSDQDDIWMTDKLIIAINKIKDNYNGGSVLYCSNQILVDKDLKKIGMRYDIAPDISCEQIFSVNKVSGCTMVWNKTLQKLLCNKKPSCDLLKCRIHDVWVAIVASISGKIIYDSNGYILYRQHENNVVGGIEDNKLDKLKYGIKKIKEKKLRNGRSLMAKEVLELFPEQAKKYNVFLLSKDLESINGKLKIIRNNKLFRQYTGENRLSFSLKVLLGVF